MSVFSSWMSTAVRVSIFDLFLADKLTSLTECLRLKMFTPINQ